MMHSQYNKYKRYLIETKVPDGTSTTVYRCGPMVDLCVGPHIPNTGKIKAFMVTKVSSFVCSLSLSFLDHRLFRIPRLISSVIQTMTLCNAFMGFLSLTRNNCQTTRFS